MKISKYLSVSAAGMLLLAATASCDYLDKDPENSVPEENVDFTKTENQYQAVSGVYAKVRTGGTHWVVWPISIIRDDDVWSGRTDDQGSLVDMGEAYNYDNSFWGLNELWTQHYGIVKVANSALESLAGYAANTKDNAALKKNAEYAGEVRFLRAYAYYRLTQTFGDVTILKENKQQDLSRSTLDAVQKYMLEDLNFAMNNCPRVRPNQMEHAGAVTAYSAMMLAAKIHLNRGEFAEVERLTDVIVSDKKFSLYPDFYQLFKIPGKLCDESLFEIQCTDFGIGGGDMIGTDNWFAFQGPANEGPISGWGFIGYTKKFQDWAAARGETVRMETSFLKKGMTTREGDFIKGSDNPTQTDCWNGKAYTPLSQLTEGRLDYGCNNNVRVFRYADVLLMNAEAKVRMGKSGDEPFNLVRVRANMPEITGVTLDQIIDERRMELCGEWGDRYNDIVRTGKAEQLLKEGQGKDGQIASGWTKAKTYYPIPLEQVTTNPDLNNEPHN